MQKYFILHILSVNIKSSCFKIIYVSESKKSNKRIKRDLQQRPHTLLLPEPAEHVAGVAAMSTVVTPGEPVVELSQFVFPRQVHFFIRLTSSCKKKKRERNKTPVKMLLWAIRRLGLTLNIQVLPALNCRTKSTPGKCSVKCCSHLCCCLLLLLSAEHLSTCSSLPWQLETGVPMFMRQRAQRGSGFLQPGQLVTFDLVGEPLTPYWLKLRPWWGIALQLYEMDFPQKLQLTNTCQGEQTQRSADKNRWAWR